MTELFFGLYPNFGHTPVNSREEWPAVLKKTFFVAIVMVFIVMIFSLCRGYERFDPKFPYVFLHCGQGQPCSLF
jgi:hypothetical protein